MVVRPADVIEFWSAAGPDAWYRQDDAFDAEIRERFLEAWETVATADFEASAQGIWFESPEATLGLVILLDQFPRNMFRGEARAFSTDARARAVAKKAIEKGWDSRIEGPIQQFFYLPLMHAECLGDQDRAIRLFKTRMSESASNLLHARVHREIIRRFGRFPFRNAALDRASTEAEAEFLDGGGYGKVLQELQAA